MALCEYCISIAQRVRCLVVATFHDVFYALAVMLIAILSDERVISFTESWWCREDAAFELGLQNRIMTLPHLVSDETSIFYTSFKPQCWGLRPPLRNCLGQKP